MDEEASLLVGEKAPAPQTAAPSYRRWVAGGAVAGAALLGAGAYVSSRGAAPASAALAERAAAGGVPAAALVASSLPPLPDFIKDLTADEVEFCNCESESGHLGVDDGVRRIGHDRHLRLHLRRDGFDLRLRHGRPGQDD